ncbi:hypothetical protein RHS04_09552 [Rhizoctonia solani]|uniref:Uncharacterized protein n=1 Tax=Rhizoctonia solani TaxID=456999 RepID=A0A8H7GZW2_9AGAM|nr:hypothetical protein RHS04_09552 [Rhizoctonia solani]
MPRAAAATDEARHFPACRRLAFCVCAAGGADADATGTGGAPAIAAAGALGSSGSQPQSRGATGESRSGTAETAHAPSHPPQRKIHSHVQRESAK